ncbi:hypothetical protein [Cellulosimicrobium cellulans]|uniref:COG4315 family predicted lipoprotein n=1 Tax=Cellulosimicrobium cellulans TaxID=1710 RepID=UPI0024067168|nr:hypothetical protein [Cellulosimicrobium cellulans]
MNRTASRAVVRAGPVLATPTVHSRSRHATHLTTTAPALGTADSSLGTIVVDGELQVTVDGRPVYTYAADTGPDDVTGQGVNGVWHVVAPDGTEVMDSAPQPGRATDRPAWVPRRDGRAADPRVLDGGEVDAPCGHPRTGAWPQCPPGLGRRLVQSRSAEPASAHGWSSGGAHRQKG